MSNIAIQIKFHPPKDETNDSFSTKGHKKEMKKDFVNFPEWQDLTHPPKRLSWSKIPIPCIMEAFQPVYWFMFVRKTHS